MENTSENKKNIPKNRQSKHLSLGILAHVDAGKTTLSEALLYLSGSIRKIGRVDNKDAFLDTYELERARGITIFSKQAVMTFGDRKVTLLDTPGHVDFSAEMERTLQVLDYAILVISGADGVQGHTQTLWRLLEKYHIPVFLFINKMDQNGTDKEKLLNELKSRLSDGCLDFSGEHGEAFFEEAAMCDETALEDFLENGTVSEDHLKGMIRERKIFPCYFGSALKLTGIEQFIAGMDQYMITPEYPSNFGAKVFKISRDDQGNRLTHMKITGGVLKVRSMLSYGDGSDTKDGSDKEKVNQIRIYSGDKYDMVNEAEAGEVCAVTGPLLTRPGQGLGIEATSEAPVLTPVLTYQILLPEGCEPAVILPKLRQLEEEEPELHIVWNEKLREIQAQIMGEVQVEILQSLIEQRFGVHVEFDSGNIVYKETILNRVEGVGHFEPLRHYAEVHLILEPGEPGSGLVFESHCSEDMLDRNWQRLILTHLAEKEHLGVLAGFPITDMRIILASGRAHLKHTEGGDFRQATYRAVRQGLMQAESVLLEPYYDFRLEIPDKMLGRALNDMDRLRAVFEAPRQFGETAVLCGSAPVASMRDYPKEVIAYTRGQGQIFCTFKGYERCHNATEVIGAIGYEAERDLENPPGSVFCAHGAGFNVSWDQVPDYMHLESVLKYYDDNNDKNIDDSMDEMSRNDGGDGYEDELWIDTEEIDSILERTFYANRRGKSSLRPGIRRRTAVKEFSAPVTRSYRPPKDAEQYLLVDGYNIIFAWDDLKEMAKDNIDGARWRLMDILCNYQAIRKCHLIVVFDAYKVVGNVTSVSEYKNIHVVYTKEAETADQYIEKFAHENARKYHVTVATSDGLEQMIIRSKGCGLLSAREFLAEVEQAGELIQKEYMEKQVEQRNFMFDGVDEKKLRKVGEMVKKDGDVE